MASTATTAQQTAALDALAKSSGKWGEQPEEIDQEAQEITLRLLPSCSKGLIKNDKFSDKYADRARHMITVNTFIGGSGDFVEGSKLADQFAGYWTDKKKFIPSPALERFFEDRSGDVYVPITTPSPSAPIGYIKSAIHRLVKENSNDPFAKPNQYHKLVLVRINKDKHSTGGFRLEAKGGESGLANQCLQFLSGIPLMSGSISDMEPSARKKLFEIANWKFSSLVGKDAFQLGKLDEEEYWMELYYKLVEKVIESDYVELVDLETLPRVTPEQLAEKEARSSSRSGSRSGRSGSVSGRPGRSNSRSGGRFDKPRPEPEDDAPRGRRADHNRFAPAKSADKPEYETLEAALREIANLRGQLAVYKEMFQSMKQQ